MTNEHLRTSKGKNDECYTYDYAVYPLLKYMDKFRDKVIWCPFDKNESKFCRVFRRCGFNVVNSHIDYGQDFYRYEPDKWDVLISNPPFSGKTEIFKRVIGFNKPFALLMKYRQCLKEIQEIAEGMHDLWINKTPYTDIDNLVTHLLECELNRIRYKFDDIEVIGNIYENKELLCQK